tara:strand:- start:159 stop:1130 length:972 start_codon:yes stop_codon:yes gene_type:complete
MAVFVPFLIAVGGQAIRVGTAAAARYFAKKGANKITQETAKKMGRILTAGGADDAARLFAKYGKDIAKYRPATQLKPASKVVKPKPKPADKPKPKVDKPKSNVTPDRKPVKPERKPVKPTRKPVKPDTKVVRGGSGGSTRGGSSQRPSTNKRVGTPSAASRPTAAGAAGKRMPKLTRKQKIAAGIGIGGATVAVVDKLVGDSKKKKKRGTPPLGGPSDGRKKSGRPPLGGPSDGRKKSGRPPLGGPSDGRKKSGRPPLGGPSDGRKKRTNITAGANTGFGPKGNIFPKNAEDRKRLMDLYGGTGSRAAKAAAAGTQGTLKKRK